MLMGDFAEWAGSIMYLQGTDLRKEALCPVIFYTTKRRTTT